MDRKSLSNEPLLAPSSSGSEWQVLLECACSKGPEDRLSEMLSRDTLQWLHLLKRAADHGIFPLLAARLLETEESLVPENVRIKIREQYRTHIIFTLRVVGELLHLVQAFKSAGIAVLLTKGPVLSQRCYGDTGIRQYGDLDVIVFEKNILDVTEIMIGQGYASRIPVKAIERGRIPGEYMFRRADNLLVEFHTEQTFRYFPRRLQIDNFFANQVPVELDGRAIPALCAEDELVLLCVHAAKHFWERLMWVADIAALLPSVDWHRAFLSAHAVGAERMLRVGVRLASCMLKFPLSPEMERNVCFDRTALTIASEIANRLPHGDSENIGLLRRAFFRIRMRRGLLRGAAYLARLSFSPTEEDWKPDFEGRYSWVRDAMVRPVRLAGKYRKKALTSQRNAENTTTSA